MIARPCVVWMVLPAALAAQPRTDVHGDPLPPGAIARLGTTRDRAFGCAAVAYSPDGKWLAIGGLDSSIRIVDASTGREVHRVACRQPPVTQLAFAPDSGRLLTSVKGSMELVDIRNGVSVATRTATGEANRWPAVFMADGLSIAWGRAGYSLDFLDVAKLELRRPPLDLVEGQAVFAVALDGSALAVCNYDGPHDIWTLGPRERVGRVPTIRGDAAVAVAPGGNRVAVLRVRPTVEVRVWDVPSGKLLHAIRLGDSARPLFAFSPDGGTLYGCDTDRILHAWDVATGRQRWQYGTPDRAFRQSVPVAVSPNGTTLATPGWDQMPLLLDAASGKPLAEPDGHRGPVLDLAWRSKGEVVTVSSDGTLRAWDAATGRQRLCVELGVLGARTLALSSDGAIATIGTSHDQTLRRFGLNSGTPVGALTAKYVNVSRIARSPDEKTLVASSGNRLWWWDGDRETSKDIEPEVGSISDLAFSPDGCVVAVAGDAGITVHGINGEILHRLRGHTGAVTSVAFSSDGRLLATVGSDSTTRLWEVASGMERRRTVHPTDLNGCVALSPHGLLAISGKDREIRLFDPYSPDELAALTGHDFWVSRLQFSPDGRRLASASYDATALIWDVSSKQRRGGVERSEAELARAWVMLGEPDAAAAWNAAGELIRSPAGTVRLARAKTMPESSRPAVDIPKLIRNLDAERFAVRENASVRLREVLDAAAPLLNRAWVVETSAESRRRIRALLDEWRKRSSSSAMLTATRMVEVLEAIGTPEARLLLEEFARGDPTSQRTLEAKAAVSRLGKASER